jgi:hypothetical protein
VLVLVLVLEPWRHNKHYSQSCHSQIVVVVAVVDDMHIDIVVVVEEQQL